MPLAYEIDPRRRIVTITGEYAEPAEWRALLAAIGDDPAYPGGCSFLRDLRDSRHPVTPESVMGIMTVVGEFWAQLQVRRAAIVTRPGIDPAATVAHALAEDRRLPLRAFTSHDDAIAWLSGDPPRR